MRTYLDLKKLMNTLPHGRPLHTHIYECTTFEPVHGEEILCTMIKMNYDQAGTYHGKYQIDINPDWPEKLKDIVKELHKIKLTTALLSSNKFKISEIQKDAKQGIVPIYKPVLLMDYFSNQDPATKPTKYLEKQFVKQFLSFDDSSGYFQPISVFDQKIWLGVVYLLSELAPLKNLKNFLVDKYQYSLIA